MKFIAEVKKTELSRMLLGRQQALSSSPLGLPTFPVGWIYPQCAQILHACREGA